MNLTTNASSTLIEWLTWPWTPPDDPGTAGSPAPLKPRPGMPPVAAARVLVPA